MDLLRNEAMGRKNPVLGGHSFLKRELKWIHDVLIETLLREITTEIEFS
jgi:hypothetical protein